MLDKMPNPQDYIPTHKGTVLHIQKNPVPCIIDDHTSFDQFKDAGGRLVGFLNKDEELGLLLGFKLYLASGDSSLEYTVYPDEGFADALILHDVLCIINSGMEQLLSIRIDTDQFVKTRSELEKFAGMME